MEKEVKVSDQIKEDLDKIAEDLWAIPGKAVVMVGAGLSKNSSRENFPTWEHLGDKLFSKLYKRKPGNDDRYINVPDLAEEFEAKFGVKELRTFLKKNIKCDVSKPSVIHKKLLELPWVDIFTTNYDTLLEKGLYNIISKRYEVVYTPRDLVIAQRPRIIKLHGSFSNKQPLIITQEDYRKYPKNYPLFVNTVQQALIENTLCLIGFSGNDPNFLQWMGWIRDNLGDKQVKNIYLIGVFEESKEKRRLLEKRNIQLVNFLGSHNISKIDHEKALTRFIQYLEVKKSSVNRLDWPREKTDIYVFSKISAKKEQTIKEKAAKWHLARNDYPGWIIVPGDKRKQLWENTEGWDSVNLDDFEFQTRLDYLYELTWRMEKALQPISNNLAEQLEKIVSHHQPKNDIPPQIGIAESFETTTLNGNGTEYSIKWGSAALTLLEYFRETGNLSKWNHYQGVLLKNLKLLNADQKNQLIYEECLCLLNSFSLSDLVLRLKNWKPSDEGVKWLLNKAGLLAEVGRTRDSTRLLRQILEKIRKKKQKARRINDLTLDSVEAYAYMLLMHLMSVDRLIGDSNPTTDEWDKIEKLFEDEIRSINEIKREEDIKLNLKDEWSKFRSGGTDANKKEKEKYLQLIREEDRRETARLISERLTGLKAYYIDPRSEIFRLTASLESHNYNTDKQSIREAFDLSQIHYHITSPNVVPYYANSILRFFVQIGLPVRAPFLSFYKKALSNAMQVSFSGLPELSITTYFRLGDHKLADIVFNREYLSKITPENSNQRIFQCLHSIKRIIVFLRKPYNKINEPHFEGHIQAHVEAISRLVSRSTLDAKEAVVNWIKDEYSGKTKRIDFTFLLFRLVRSLRGRELSIILPKLIAFPCPNRMTLNTRDNRPNPLIYVSASRVDTEHILSNKNEYDDAIEAFLRLISGKAKRSWAINSLVKLQQLGLLSIEQKKRFGDGLWKYKDIDGFPADTGFYKYAFLRLPFPQKVNLFDDFKKYLLNTPFPIQKKQSQNSVQLTFGNIELVNEFIGAKDIISWRHEEILDVYSKIVDWWESDKINIDGCQEESNFISKKWEFKERFNSMTDLLAEAVIPAIPKKTTAEIRTSISKLLKDLKDRDIPVLRAEMGALHLFPHKKKRLLAEAKQRIYSGNSHLIRDGLAALNKYFEGEFHAIKKNEVFFMLYERIESLKNPGLPEAINLASYTLLKHPIIINQDLVKRMIKILEVLEKATDYKNPFEIEGVNRKTRARISSARLAFCLYNELKEKGSPTYKVFNRWRNICNSPDEFSEVRCQWS